jgi:signal transduction histidine kinase/signal recognition particle subunit SEC65
MIVFIIAVSCFSGAITIIFNNYRTHGINFRAINEISYFLSKDYINETSDILNNLRIIQQYKNVDFILGGNTISSDEIKNATDNLFEEFTYNSDRYNPKLSDEENYEMFAVEYADRISQVNNRLIQDDLREYNSALRYLEACEGVIYYSQSGDFEFTNSTEKTADYFKTFPSYIVLAGYQQNVFPHDIKSNSSYGWLQATIDQFNQQDLIYVAFTDQFLNPRVTEWKAAKALATYSLSQITWLTLAFFIAFLYLLWVTGRRPQADNLIHFSSIDRIYNDLNLCLCGLLIASEAGALVVLDQLKLYQFVFPVTFIIAAMGFVLVLAMVKHLKNKSFLRHTLTYAIFFKLFAFFKDIYNTGTTAVKVIIIVIAYPIIAGLTFFMFPITIGIACWLALKKVKEFNLIKTGVQLVKDGDLHHTIDIPGEDEFACLAADINHITDGLNQAVANEVKSERLKSELISNVSHDLRTPLTAIITYVDLLKKETDQEKAQEYIEVIEQKSQRLKALTDDLFEAAKASSGDMPVNFEKIDIVSLITQGLGELDDKIQAQKLEFKLAHPRDKMLVKADGKLLWRAVENLLSNIFKYALEGSRVYIDIEDEGRQIKLTMKNISAFALNVSADELMERFKRGDEARSSQGSGLGLSIAKSLIEIQNGSFRVDIDGDLFKVTMQMESME